MSYMTNNKTKGVVGNFGENINFYRYNFDEVKVTSKGVQKTTYKLRKLQALPQSDLMGRQLATKKNTTKKNTTKKTTTKKNTTTKVTTTTVNKDTKMACLVGIDIVLADNKMVNVYANFDDQTPTYGSTTCKNDRIEPLTDEEMIMLAIIIGGIVLVVCICGFCVRKYRQAKAKFANMVEEGIEDAA